MNIFVLSTSPYAAATMHCDQHMHKMILESAQILSTVAHKRLPPDKTAGYYKPTHQNHPCVLWASENLVNALWIARLAISLNELRLNTGSDKDHKSLAVVEKFYVDFLVPVIGQPTEFIFCGPEHIAKKSYLTVPQKYQEYYQYKSLTWEKQMTWKNRTIPSFMNTLN